MHVIAVHDIKDPEGFRAAIGPTLEKIPAGMKLHSMFPGEDGVHAVCVWEAGSVDDVREFVDPATAGLAENDYFSVADAQAIGLPQASAATA